MGGGGWGEERRNFFYVDPPLLLEDKARLCPKRTFEFLFIDKYNTTKHVTDLI